MDKLVRGDFRRRAAPQIVWERKQGCGQTGARCPRLKDTTARAFKPSSMLVQEPSKRCLAGSDGGDFDAELRNYKGTKMKKAVEADSIRVSSVRGYF